MRSKISVTIGNEENGIKTNGGDKMILRSMELKSRLISALAKAGVFKDNLYRLNDNLNISQLTPLFLDKSEKSILVTAEYINTILYAGYTNSTDYIGVNSIKNIIEVLLLDRKSVV